MNNKCLYQEQKPLFSVGKALIYLAILIFNLWSFDVFSATQVRGYEYACQRDSNGIGIDSGYIGSWIHRTDISIIGNSDALALINEFRALYKFSERTSSSYYKVSCLLTDEPTPVSHETCWSGNEDYAVSSMTITEKEDLPTYSSTDSFGYAGCLYTVSYTENTTQDWQNPCYDFTLTRVDVGTDTSNIEPDLTSYQCEAVQETTCYDNNPDAVASFSISQKQSLPLINGRFNFAGCAYDVQQTVNTSQDWSGSCYDFTLTRYDLITSASASIPTLTECSTTDTTPPDTSDNEDVQQVLDNQAILSDNQNTITDNQNTLLDNQNLLADNDASIIDNQNSIISDLENTTNTLLTNDDEILDALSALTENSEVVSSLDKINSTLENNQNTINNLINESSASTTEDYANNGVDLMQSIGDQALEDELESFKDELKKDVDFLGAGGKDSPISQKATEHWGLKFDYIFPQAQQCSIEIPNPITGLMIPLDTRWSIFLKEILAWVISFYTFLSLFSILFTPVSPKN